MQLEELTILNTYAPSAGAARYMKQVLNNLQRDLDSCTVEVFQTMQKEGILPNSFYETNIILIPKPGRGTTKKIKLQANIYDEH